MKLLTLPLPANKAQLNAHWQKVRRLRTDYFFRATAADNWRPDAPMRDVHVDAHFYVYNRMDEDNLAARMKWPLDWLEAREIIENDKHVRLTCEQSIDRKNQRLELTIREVA